MILAKINFHQSCAKRKSQKNERFLMTFCVNSVNVLLHENFCCKSAFLPITECRAAMVHIMIDMVMIYRENFSRGQF